MEPDDSNMVIGYQVDKCTFNWSVENFVTWSHIYAGFTAKLSSLTHFQLEPVCGDCLFLHKALADFEQDLDSILTDSIKMLELDASFVEPGGVPSPVSWGYLHSFFTISDTSKLQLAPGIKSHKLWCQARALLLPVPVAGKMSSKLIWYFSSHPAAFGFWSSPPDKLHSESSQQEDGLESVWFLDWHWCGCLCHFWHRAAYFSYQNSSCWYHCLFSGFWRSANSSPGNTWIIMIHDILDSVVSKLVGNAAHIWCLFLILLPGSIVKSGLHTVLFFPTLRIPLLVKLAFMAALTCLLHRLSNNIPLACISLQLLWEVAGPDQELVFVQYTKAACDRLVGALWQKTSLRLQDRELSEFQEVLQWWCICQCHWLLRRRGSMGDGIPHGL